MKIQNVAIVGFGAMGHQHAKMMEQVEEVNLLGSYDISNERQMIARDMGLFVYSSLNDLLDDPKVDIVLIATPNHLHKDIAIRAMRAGKHVICEKPVTLCAKDLEDIIAVAKECNRIFTVHQNRRWDEDFLMVKKVHEDQTIGKLYRIESRVMGSQGIPGDWRTKREFGGGMLLDWGIHLADQLLWLMPQKISTIYCTLGHILGGECDDSVELHLNFEDGLQALIEVRTWNMELLPRWYVNGMDGTMTVRDFWIRLGSITRLKEDVKNNTKPIEAGKGITRTMAPRDPETLETLQLPRFKVSVRDFYRNVTKAIAGEENLIVRPEQSLRVMRLMDVARISAEMNQVVSFE